MSSFYDQTLRAFVHPDSWGHKYTYNADATIATESFTDGVSSWVKSYTYIVVDNIVVLDEESGWVLQ
jgi:hypothetical protein